MILRNVELYWAKLDPSNYDMGFGGDKPQWNVQVRIRDKAQAEAAKAEGLNLKLDEDDSGTFYRASLRKDALKKDGTANLPVPVVGRDRHPVQDVTSIGNGTIANVKVREFDWTFNNKSGKGFRLDSIQIVDLIRYEVVDEEDFDFIEDDSSLEEALGEL